MKRLVIVLVALLTAPAVSAPAAAGYTRLAPPFIGVGAGTLCSSTLGQGACTPGDENLAASAAASKNGSGSVSAFARFGSARAITNYVTAHTLAGSANVIDYQYVIKASGSALASATGSASVDVTIDVQHSCGCFSYQETQVLIASGESVSSVTFTRNFLVSDTSLFGPAPIPAGDLTVAIRVTADATNEQPGASSSADATFSLRSLSYKTS